MSLMDVCVVINNNNYQTIKTSFYEKDRNNHFHRCSCTATITIAGNKELTCAGPIHSQGEASHKNYFLPTNTTT